MDLVSAADESRLFWRIRKQMIRNLLQQAVRVSRLRVFLVLVLSSAFWLGLFWLFLALFQFFFYVMPHTATRVETVRIVFGVFFIALLAMLLFSSGIILYGLLYRSRESRFLVTTPASSERIFLHKFQETMFFASWGFLLLGSPILVAYGVMSDVSWFYYVVLLPFAVSFVWIPCALGAVACILLAHFLPRAKMPNLVVLGGLLLVAAVWLGWRLLQGPQSELLGPTWFREMLARLQFSQHRLLPSWWLSTGLLEAAHTGEDRWEHFRQSALFLAVLVTNALVLEQLAVRVAGRYFRSGYSRLASRRNRGWLPQLGVLDGTVMAATLFPRRMQLMIVKDLRVFRRDPVQWSQFLIFFGLLGLYFLNIRSLIYDVSRTQWVVVISFLNLGVVGLILSTFTSRFVFPMISLEGQRFWILGRLPIRRDTILWSKFLFASLGSVLPCAALILVSDRMLDVSRTVVAVHMLVVVLLSTGLSGIAVGLGRLPNLQAESPSKIAAGFGGTLTLVISAVYIVLLILVAAVPCHFQDPRIRNLGESQFAEWAVSLQIGTMQGVVYGAATCVALGLLCTLIPMWLGFRAFRRMEF